MGHIRITLYSGCNNKTKKKKKTMRINEIIAECNEECKAQKKNGPCCGGQSSAAALDLIKKFAQLSSS